MTYGTGLTSILQLAWAALCGSEVVAAIALLLDLIVIPVEVTVTSKF